MLAPPLQSHKPRLNWDEGFLATYLQSPKSCVDYGFLGTVLRSSSVSNDKREFAGVPLNSFEFSKGISPEKIDVWVMRVDD